MQKSLQETYSPLSRCYGCGPSNEKGMRIRSFAEGGSVVCDFTPESHHEAFPGAINGGVIGTIMDCHSNWTAAHYLMKSSQDTHPPCTVTAEYKIWLLAPTPSGVPLQVRAQVVDAKPDRATVEAELSANGKITAKCRGTFVAVKPGHPAYHRW